MTRETARRLTYLSRVFGLIWTAGTGMDGGMGLTPVALPNA
jgi:hypothetical protein